MPTPKSTTSKAAPKAATPNLTEYVPRPVSYAPTSGPTGTVVTVTGERFQPTRSVLLVDGDPATGATSTATTATGTVAGPPGDVVLQVQTDYHTSKSMPFTIT